MNPIAVITGASSGIGLDFARELARTYNLILVARRKELLLEIANELNIHGNDIQIITADLSKEEDLEHLEYYLSKLKIDILVNAAGFGNSSSFHESSSGLINDMIYVHVVSSTRLSRTVLTGMLEQQHGIIINVASLSGFSKINAGNLIYNATKAYLIKFSELLQQGNNLKNKVKIQVLCPGFTRTDFFKDHDHNGKVPDFLFMKSSDVVRKSLKHISSKKTIYIPGWHNVFIAYIIGSSLLFPVLKFINKIFN